MAAPMAPSTPSGIATDELSDEVRPQDDLFRHVNSRWLATTEIPPDRAAHGAFHMLHDQSELDVRALAEEAAAGDAPAGSDERKVGDLWAAFMDVDAVEAADADPLADDLAAIRAVASPSASWSRCSAASSATARRAWSSGSSTTTATTPPATSSTWCRPASACPTRPTTGRTPTPRSGPPTSSTSPPCCASSTSPTPTRPPPGSWPSRRPLAAGHWTTVDSRDALKTHNKRTLDALDRPRPRVRVGRPGSTPSGPPTAPSTRSSSASRPPSRPRPACSASCPLADWKAWLTFHHVRSAAPVPVEPVRRRQLRLLRHAAVGHPRAARAVEAGGRPSSRARSARRSASSTSPATSRPSTRPTWTAWSAGWSRPTGSTSSTLEWMSPETRQRALDKLDKFTPKVGYPDRWRDYSALDIDRDDLLGSVRRAVGVRGRPQPGQDRWARSTATSGT